MGAEPGGSALVLRAQLHNCFGNGLRIRPIRQPMVMQLRGCARSHLTDPPVSVTIREQHREPVTVSMPAEGRDVYESGWARCSRNRLLRDAREPLNHAIHD